MTANISVCPDCDTEFETTAVRGEPPQRSLDRECPECGYDVTIGVVDYPNGLFDAIAPALEADSCTYGFFGEQCEKSATIRTQRVGGTVEARCEDHAVQFRVDAMSVDDE